MVDLSNIQTLGSNLNRPECVVTHSSGLVFASDWSGNGGVSVIRPSGKVTRILSTHTQPIRPNGIALDTDGSFLLAHLGQETGGVFRMQSSGETSPLLLDLGGQPLPPTNFVTRDLNGHCWITVSTRTIPRAAAYNPTTADGFVIRLDESGANIAADNLGYTNECLVSSDQSTLFVNETFARRLSAFDIRPDGRLENKRTVASFGPGTFPDGLNECSDGSLLITSIVSNRVIQIEPSGKHRLLVEDSDTDHLAVVEQAFHAGTMGRPHLDTAKSHKLKNISSLAFTETGGSNAVLGCLLDDQIYALDLPVCGLTGSGWQAPITIR